MRFISLHASLIKLMCFALGFYEALLGLLNLINKEVWCLDLQFHLEAFEFTMILCSLWTTQFYTFILYRLYFFPLPSFPTFLLSYHFSKQFKKKAAGTSHKQVSEWKQAHVGMVPSKNQPNKMGTTPQHIQTIPTSCAILPTVNNTKPSTSHNY